MMNNIKEIYMKNRAELGRFISFGFIGGIGAIINSLILYLLVKYVGLFYLYASAIAIEVAIIFNFFGNHYLTFRDSHDRSSLFRKFISFQSISLITVAGSLFVLWLLASSFGIRYLILLNLITIVIMFVFNFILNRFFTWNKLEKKGEA